MGLRLSLKPHEGLIINGAALRNGDRPVSFLIENQCKFLRESEIMHERDADTDCKKLCVTLQVMYLVDDPTETIELFYAQARELTAMNSSYAPYLLRIQQEVGAGRHYKAIKHGRELVAHEATLVISRHTKATA